METAIERIEVKIELLNKDKNLNFVLKEACLECLRFAIKVIKEEYK